jgi:hypothetical protein
VEIEKLPLQYVTNKATRIKVKAIEKLLTPENLSPLEQEEISLKRMPLKTKRGQSK